MQDDRSTRGLVSIDREEYVPRRVCDELREERDRLANQVQELRRALNASRSEQR